MAVDFWSIPRCWPGEAVAILAGGPSLTVDQIEMVRRSDARCIAINRAYALAPWADWLWACDCGRFWRHHTGPQRNRKWPDACEFKGEKIGVLPAPEDRQPQEHAIWVAQRGVHIMRHAGTNHCKGVSDDPTVTRGNNSLYQALSVLHFTGAVRAILLGADMHGARWHQGYDGGGNAQPNYGASVIPNFAHLPGPLAERGVEVVNCSPGSALTVFPTADLKDAL